MGGGLVIRMGGVFVIFVVDEVLLVQYSWIIVIRRFLNVALHGKQQIYLILITGEVHSIETP